MKVLALLVAAALPLAAQESRTLHYVGIAVESYGNPAVEQAGGIATAQALRDSLFQVAGPFYTTRARLLLGAAATRARVLATLDSVAREIAPGDLLVLYYRGLASPRFLVLADSAPLPPPPRSAGEAAPVELERRALRSELLGAWLAALPARAQLIVLDAPAGAEFFNGLRPQLVAAPGALRATRDLTAFASPGMPTLRRGEAGVQTLLAGALLQALGDERRDAPVRLASAISNRLLELLDEPVMVHEAGADLVLGTSGSALAMANASALSDSLPWQSSCGTQCPRFTVQGLRQSITVFGGHERLPLGGRMFVNGRRARLTDDSFEVELPPAAARATLQLRVLLPDGTRYETTGRVP